MSLALDAKSICKQYPTRSEPVIVLRDVSLSLSEGEAVAIVGPSGCGKSTLLNILGTLEPPTSGEVQLDGKNPFALDEPALAAFRNTHVGFVFQDHHLLPQCSVIENVLIPTLPNDGAARLITRAAKLLDRVGLSARLDHLPSELSGGERQRVAIARALINSPRLLLADEPTGNLDRSSAETVASLLLELQKEEGTTLIVVTHSTSLADRMQKCFEFSDGRLESRAA
ncbi:ATP-binding protein [cyanobacterium TDX16]|nr:ATP-binding protein [cyanobacterium TDX16]